MYDRGKCWGYGNVPVAKDAVCDSWASTDVKQAARDLWKAHRKALANSKEV